MVKISDIVQYLDSIAPWSYQEEYDNSGLIIGDDNEKVEGILTCVDVTGEVLEEAIFHKLNLVVSHHPVIFKGIKRLTNQTHTGRIIKKALENRVHILSVHTNLDNVRQGVNSEIAGRLQLKNTHLLKPRTDIYRKLVTFIPAGHTQKVLKALHEAGAGVIGNYEECSFRVSGTGSFIPGEKANPFLGKADEKEEVPEERIEVQYPFPMEKKLIRALYVSHPYEEPAYYIHPAGIHSRDIGSGLIGELPEEKTTDGFLGYLKEKMQLEMIRYTPVAPEKKISKVALCGGSGSFLLGQARSEGADAYVSSDFKYHDFFDSEGKILIADIGHYESEKFTKDLLYNLINRKFSNIALRKSEILTNPIRYYY